MPSDPVTAVQRFYPQIYGACHVSHVRARSTPFRLSSADSSLLTHLEEDRSLLAGSLARHLGIAASTLSASLKRLEGLGYLARAPIPRDRRTIGLRITALGTEALGATSVLDRRHVAGMLACLPPSQRKRAVAGLGLLARAAALYRRKHPTRRSPGL